MSPEVDEPFDPLALLEALSTAGVDFVLIGGVAAGAHGSAYGTRGTDIAVAANPVNVRRLAGLLVELASEEPPAMPVFDSRTSLGRLKCFTAPDGAPAYEALAAASLPIMVGENVVRVASLDHLIAMKQAGSRTRDRVLGTEYRVISDELRAPRDG